MKLEKGYPKSMTKLRFVMLFGILLLTAGLRFYHLADIPPGWRDDEIVETTLHAQMILEGQRPLFFVQAEGHEPLYHYLAAGLIALSGNGLGQVRWLSAAFGILSVAALYRLAHRWFGAFPASVASLALAVSFWSLMYSRTKTRHVSVLVFAILTFYLFDRLIQTQNAECRAQNETTKFRIRHSAFRILLFGLCLALSLYTYFAARALPFILVAFSAYLALFHRDTFKARWRSMALGFAIAAVFATPLFVAESRAGGGAERLSVVGGPFQSLLNGDPRPVLSNTLNTLGMFAFRGDPEALYNIPGRPVFEAVGAVLLTLGILISLARWRQPRYALLIFWLVGGLAPAFVSLPAGSLGHSILAQPVVYLFPAVALAGLYRWQKKRGRPLIPVYFMVATLLGLTAARDLYDYFVVWPADPQVRFLYRAGLHEAARFLRENLPPGPVAMTTLNLDPRDPLALQLDLPTLAGRARFYDPARAYLYPAGRPALTVFTAHNTIASTFEQYYSFPAPHPGFTSYPPGPLPPAPRHPSIAAFANGLVFIGYDGPLSARPGETLSAVTFWKAGPGWAPLLLRQPSDPTRIPVGLKAFLHLTAEDGAYLSGADDFGVEPSTLQPGDAFLQLHTLIIPADLPPGDYPLIVGLYDPFSGERAPILGGGDAFQIGSLSLSAP